MAKIRTEELQQLTGELLPERMVLAAAPHHGSTTVASACSAFAAGTTGVAGVLGDGAFNSVECVPAWVVTTR